MEYVIRPARTCDDIRDAGQLFSAYASWLNVDLAFQDFENEVRSLPGKYAHPTGEILIARAIHGVAIGCVALRPLDSNAQDPRRLCEMKRLYVVPQARKSGIGQKLVEDIIAQGIQSGYTQMRLDTLSHMRSALALYEQHGFKPIESYYENPLPGATFLARDLP